MRFRVVTWKPGTRVELRAIGSFSPARVLLSHLAATAVGFALPLSVLVMLNAAFGIDLLTVHLGNGRFSIPGLLSYFTAVSAGIGWLSAFPLWLRRRGGMEATFDWTAKQLSVRDDTRFVAAYGLDGPLAIPFADVAALSLHESSDSAPRYTLEARIRGRAPVRLFETEPNAGAAGDHHLAPLSLTIDLARSLGVAWRCVSGRR